MNQDIFYTLTQAATHETEIKKSRFLARAQHVSSTENALSCIRQVSDPAASHNCWAWRMGQDYRFHDDGEPSGSAGKPILAAIDGQGLDQVIVIVTRWFGGTKLGVGGLMRAYGGCAAECLRQAGRKPIIEKSDAILHCGYSEFELLKARMQALDVQIQNEEFGAQGVKMHLRLPSENVQALRKLLADVTRGQGALRVK